MFGDCIRRPHYNRIRVRVLLVQEAGERTPFGIHFGTKESSIHALVSEFLFFLFSIVWPSNHSLLLLQSTSLFLTFQIGSKNSQQNNNKQTQSISTTVPALLPADGWPWLVMSTTCQLTECLNRLQELKAGNLANVQAAIIIAEEADQLRA